MDTFNSIYHLAQSFGGSVKALEPEAQIDEIDRRLGLVYDWCVAHNVLMVRADVRVALGIGKETYCDWVKGQSSKGVPKDAAVAEIYARRGDVLKKWQDAAESWAGTLAAQIKNAASCMFKLKAEDGWREYNDKEQFGVAVSLEDLLALAEARRKERGNT